MREVGEFRGKHLSQVGGTMRADLKNQGPSKAEAKILEGTARHWWKLWPNARFRLSGDVPRSSLSGCSPPLADIRSHRCAHIFGVSTEIASRAHGLASVDDFQSDSRYRCASCREDVRKAELVIERLTLSNPAGAASSYQAPRVWLGPQGTVTPMHCDYTENSGPLRVRVSGWLMYDEPYDTRPSPWTIEHLAPRVTGWEIHPVTKLERWDADRLAWVELAR